MTKQYFGFLFLLFHLTLSAAPTEVREWTAVSGDKVLASATKVEGDKVLLEKATGSIVKVPLHKFIESDQELLTKHFKIGQIAPSDVPLATDLPYPQGKIAGPIDAGNGSSYFLYLPTSLKKERNAPLLFITNANPGKSSSLDRAIKAAELLGWVLAVSVESSNDSRFAENVEVSKTAVKHIFKTLPVDKNRVYFTGYSGGGATCLANASEIKAQGAMPCIAYIPRNYEPKAKDYIITGGGGDFNRYTSANARVRLGDNAIHRMYPAGHRRNPEWLIHESLVRFHCLFLARNKGDYPKEEKDFEYALLNWIEQNLESKNSHLTYTIGQLLIDDYQIEGAGKIKLTKLLAQLSKAPQNIAYYSGIKDLDQFSQDHLSNFGTGSQNLHSDPKISAAAQLMAEKYKDIPIIEKTFQALAGKTDKLN